MMRRFVTSAIAVAMLGLVVAGGALAGKPVVDVQVVPGDFTLTSECPNLPPNTTITGVGSGRSTTVTQETGGVTTIFNLTQINGTATDQAYNTYVFNYTNIFRLSNTVANPDFFSGKMVDSFSLFGRGPARLNNGFVANLNGDNFTILASFGDPLTPEGESLCDPL